MGFETMSSLCAKTHFFPKRRAKSASFRTQKRHQQTIAVLICSTKPYNYKLAFSLKTNTPKKQSIIYKIPKVNGSLDDSKEELYLNGKPKKRGTITGAVSLIIGTSIGSGILALPQTTSSAGFIPSAVSMSLCWGFLLIEALLLAEINIHLREKWKKDETEGDDLEVISIRTMAQELLGEKGANVASIIYVFMAYTSVVAYTSKSGEVLSGLINLPDSISGIFFTLILALLILVGGINITDIVNQMLTVTMIGLLVAIEVAAFSFGDWFGTLTTSNWNDVPQTIPVIIFSLVYHDITPVICAYLGSDRGRIRVSIVIGSFVPLLLILLWNGIALSISLDQDGVDPLNLLVRGSQSSIPLMVEAFSLLAVGTSLIGTLLGFSQFFVEQLNNIFASPTPAQAQKNLEREVSGSKVGSKMGSYDASDWWRNNRSNFYATSLVLIPSVLVSIMVPHAFSVATDIAGGYCMTILYGVLPPAMAWVLESQSSEEQGEDQSYVNESFRQPMMISEAKPVLIGVGLFSCGIVLEQVLQDLL